MNLLKFITNLHIRRYSKKMYKTFPFVGNAELAYINDYIGQVEEFLDDYPRSSYKDIVDCIGSPENAVQSYIENMGYNYLKPKLDISGNILRASRYIIVIAILGCAAYLGIVYKNYEEDRASDGYYIKTEIIDESTESDSTEESTEKTDNTQDSEQQSISETEDSSK